MAHNSYGVAKIERAIELRMDAGRRILERAPEGTELRASDQRAPQAHADEVTKLRALACECGDTGRRDQERQDAFAALEARPATGNTRSTADNALMDEFRSMILEHYPRPIEVADPSPRSFYQPGVELRALSKTSPANFQPVSFYSQIIEALVETSAVMSAGATVVTTQSGEDLRVPRSTALSTAAIVAEAGTIRASDPTCRDLGRVQIRPVHLRLRRAGG